MNDLEVAFQSATTPRSSTMFAKHALLELCGWIEEAEDYIIKKCAAKLTDIDLKNLVEKRIKFNSAFHFTDNFLPLLAIVIGLIKYQMIQDKLTANSMYFTNLVSTINGFKDPRNKHAHSHFEPGKPQINILLNGQSPNSIKQKANDIYLGFCELETCLKKHKLL